MGSIPGYFPLDGIGTSSKPLKKNWKNTINSSPLIERVQKFKSFKSFPSVKNLNPLNLLKCNKSTNQIKSSIY